jgi:hypothetical protein
MQWNEEFVIVVPKASSNLTLTLWEKRASKSKEKATSSVLLNWNDLSAWRALERKIPISKVMTLMLTMQFGPMQVMSSTPESTKMPEMRLSFERNHFWPGEIVRGVLSLNVNQPRLIHGIQLGFDGFNYVDWFDEIVERCFTGTDIYFQKRHMLMGSRPTNERLVRKASKYGADQLSFMDDQFNDIGIKTTHSDTIELKAGQHHFPFEFQLPLNIPHSVSHMDGCVGIFYFVNGKIFEFGGRKDTLIREEIQIAPPRINISQDPSVSHTSSETKIITSKKAIGSTGDNFAHSIRSDSTLETTGSLTDSFWSQSASSLDRLSYLEESHLKSFSSETDVDLDGDDAKWLSHKNDAHWMINMDQQRGEDKKVDSAQRLRTPWLIGGTISSEAGLEFDSSPLDDDDEEDILTPRFNESENSERGGSSLCEQYGKSKSSRPAPVAVNAILPPLAVIGKPFVFQVTIENRSNKPINSLRASLRSGLYLSGYPGGRPYKRLREYWSPKGIVNKTIINGKQLPNFPILPNTSWRGDITIMIPPNLYPSISVRHLTLDYELKIEARSSSKLLVGSFSYKQAIQVVQAHADREVQLITPPTKIEIDPCQIRIGKVVPALAASIVPMPITARGTIPVTGFQFPKAVFKQ